MASRTINLAIFDFVTLTSQRLFAVSAIEVISVEANFLAIYLGAHNLTSDNGTRAVMAKSSRFSKVVGFAQQLTF